MLKKIFFSFFAFCFIIFIYGCSNKYNMDDFASVNKIDAHVHLNTANSAFLEAAGEHNFRILSVNVDYPDFPSVDSQYQFAALHLKNDPAHFAYVSTFSMNGWDNPEWVNQTINHLDSTVQHGAIGVKFWKNIGMVSRDSSGKLIMLDDNKFDPVFSHLINSKVPVICHCGEPRDCWLAVESMMSNDMKTYFGNHPQYHMYLHPEMPSYEDQINARNAMLAKNKELTFVGAHVGSLEWSVDEVIKFLDAYPNANVDLAARMDYFQLQSQKDWEKVRKFFTDYKDRILYGSDLIVNPADDPQIFKQVVKDKWMSDWKYLATNDEMSIPIISGTFKGLNLDKDVIDHIYYKNAEKIFITAWK